MRISRSDLEGLGPADLDRLELILDQIRANKASGRAPWLCRVPGCDGSPHEKGLWTGPHARPNQRPPTDDEWDTWILLAGRGFGKTRCGAEWVWRKAKQNPGSRGALIGATASDVRDTIVKGESGILACCPPTFRPEYSPSKRELVYPNGSIQTLYSAQEPDRLRGPQHHYGWFDEMAAWQYMQDTWDMAQMGMRLGGHPQICITTTPRPLALLRELIKDPLSRVVRGSTYDNLSNLAPTFQRAVIAKYEGTELGRQELDGDILEELAGALVARRHITDHRLAAAPEMLTITVGMDPAGTGTGDETGLVVVGRGVDKRDYVLEDASMRMGPDQAAKTAFRLLDVHQASVVVVEDNGGKDWIEEVLKKVWKHELKREGPPPIRRVNASQGKKLRAQPVAMRYEQGRVSHVGTFRDLEDQLTTWIPEEDPFDSPDHLDALVHAIAYHMKRYDRGESSFGNPHHRAQGAAPANLPVTSLAVRRAMQAPRNMPGRAS